MPIYIQNISKTYKDKKALNNCSLTLDTGIHALLGPNGAGKSTLMNILVGNLDADSGTIFYGDNQNTLKKINEMGQRYRKMLGFMPQYPGMYPNFTIEYFMKYVAYLKAVGNELKHAQKKETIEKQINSILKAVDLYSIRMQKICTLSGGMKQRLALAQAILGEPSILILDEPTAGLDPKQRIAIRNYISQIALDKIVIIATHIVSDIEYIAQDIIVFNNGDLIAHNTPNELISLMNGKVWSVTIEKGFLLEFQEKYKVVNILPDDNKANLLKLRIISDISPTLDAIAVMPTLEDYYLYLFGD